MSTQHSLPTPPKILVNQTAAWHGTIPQFPDAENNLLKDMLSRWKSSDLGPSLPDCQA